MSLARRLLVVVSIAVIAACGGSGGDGLTGGGGGGGGTGRTANEGAKLTFVRSMGTQMNTWRALPRAQRHANLVAWAKASPLVQDAGVEPSTDNVWILYKDGDGTMYIDNRTPSPAPIASQAQSQIRKNDVPGAVKATVIWSLEDGLFEDSTEGIRLDLNNYGYTATRLVKPTIEQLLSAINGSGVLFWQAHSGICRDKFGDQIRTRYAINIGMDATVALGQGAYKPYREAGELLLVAREIILPNGEKEAIPVYAISDLFITRHLSMAPNAFVAMDSCTSNAAPLRTAFQTANAGTYVGWNALAGFSSGQRHQLMFDRLLGVNLEPPMSNPPERPFDIDAVQFWMQDKGYDMDPSPGSIAQLQWSYKAGFKSLILRPTIARAIFEARDNQSNFTKYLIEGTFGPDPRTSGKVGRVMWGNTECQIVSWDEVEGIKIRPPKPYPTGDLQVIKGSLFSNRVPITFWTLPVTYTLYGRGTLRYTVTMNLRFRVDARGARWSPEGNIVRHPVMIFQLDDTTGQVSATGQYKPSQDTTITWSGGTPLTSKDIELIANGIIFSGDMNITSGRIENMIIQTSGTYTRTYSTTGSAPIVTQVPASLDGYFTFNVPFNTTTYVIPSGSVAPTLPIQNSEGVSATLTWGDATPLNPPTEVTQRQPGR
ncbi:MAG: hypothetical protein IT363_07700 [Methanoregulaceae archaeon]|nr:hypothetical protein [Methanoregulaceae archaeon]